MHCGQNNYEAGYTVTRALVTCDTLWGLVCLAAFVVLCNSQHQRRDTKQVFILTRGGEAEGFWLCLDTIYLTSPPQGSVVF